MANDAMIVSVDSIKFTYPKAKTMRVYAVGVAGDNSGKVMVTEPPSSAFVNHRPKRGRPAIWDFAFDGYPIYQKTGGIPDIILFHLLIVRDRSKERRVGEIIQAVVADPSSKQVTEGVGKQLAALGTGGMVAALGLNLLLPVAQLIGTIVGKSKDKVLQTVSGSMYFDATRKQQEEFSELIRSPDNNMEVDLDIFLFDGNLDTDSVADVDAAQDRLRKANLLFTV